MGKIFGSELAARRLLPDGHPLSLKITRNLGKFLLNRGRAEEAEPFLRDVLEKAAQREDVPARYLGVWQGDYGSCLARLDRFEEAKERLKSALEILKETGGIEGRDAQKVLGYLVSLFEAWDRPDEAESYRRMLTSEKDTDRSRQ